jgi:NAD(P)-dependent dehydrogenase (short-subunit alcohol dehydrogenase family)
MPNRTPHTAFVTGGGTGLGRAVALRLAGEGRPVCIASRNPAHLEPTRAEIEALGVPALAVPTDVRDLEQVRAAVERAERELGPIGVLVNNAAGNFVVRAEDLTPNGWRAVVEIVLYGTWWCTQTVGRRMLERGRGAIVNVIATYAWTGMAGVVHSASAKGGVLAMTRSLAVEWGPRGVRVNAVAPGIMLTEGASRNLGFADAATQERLREAIPLRRFASVDEVAAAIAYLASDEASYVNGECLVIDGGAWLGRPGFGTLPGS